MGYMGTTVGGMSSIDSMGRVSSMGRVGGTRLPPALVFAAQAADLACCIVWHAVGAALALLRALLVEPLLRLLWPARHGAHGGAHGGTDAVVFYEGMVTHARRAPVLHSFRYPVRTALINLDSPPPWFSEQAADHFSADEARAYAGADGIVRLLTNPRTAGYTQNPISVYYCYRAGGGGLAAAIAEVTNTPWNERVRFVFDPSGSSVRKALHVSPFMDMEGTWHLTADAPGDTLRLVVRVSHPEHGKRFFHAELCCVRAAAPASSSPSESAGLGTLLAHGLAPHRVAVWIYWQAAVLLWKGLPLHGLPSDAVKRRAEQGATHPRNAVTGTFFTWYAAPRWPWNADTSDGGGGSGGTKAGGGGANAGGAAVCPMSGAKAVVGGGGGCPFSKAKAR